MCLKMHPRPSFFVEGTHFLVEKGNQEEKAYFGGVPSKKRHPPWVFSFWLLIETIPQAWEAGQLYHASGSPRSEDGDGGGWLNWVESVPDTTPPAVQLFFASGAFYQLFSRRKSVPVF